MASVGGLFSRLLPVRRSERSRALFFAGLFTQISAAQTLGLVGSEALLLSEFGAARLPEAFVAASLTTVLGSFLYAGRVGIARNDSLFIQMLVGCGVVLLAASFGVQAGSVWVLPALFCAFYLTQAVFTNHFWTFSGDYFDAVTSKRLFPVFTIGASLGGLLGGTAAALLTEIVGPASLIGGWGVLLVLSALQLRGLRRSLRRWGPLDLEEADETSVENMRGAVQTLARSQLGVWLVLSALGMVLALFLAQYLYSEIFVRAYPDPAALAAFIGTYLAITNLLEIAIEIGVTPLLIRRLGVPTAHLVHPLLTLLSFGGLAASYGLTAGIAARMNRELVENAVAQPIRTLVYNALPPRFRGRIRAFIEGIVVYAGMSAAGLLLLLVPNPDPMLLCAVGAAAAILYLLANWRVRSAYLVTLVSGIRTGHLDLSEIEDEIGEWEASRLAGICRELLAQERGRPSRPLRQVVSSLSLHGVREPLCEGAAHVSPEVRRLCVDALRQIDDPDVTTTLEQALADENAQVRRAALGALLMRDPERLAPHADALAADVDPVMRALAASRRGDGHAVLRGMLESSDAEEVAAALDQANGSLREEIHAALRHPTPSIRSAAISAAVRIGALPGLADVEDAVESVDPGVRAATVVALEAVGTREAAQLLARLLGDSRAEIRRAAIRALSGLPSGLDVCLPYLRDEREVAVVSAQHTIAKSHDLRSGPVLRDELRHRVHQLWFRVAAFQHLPDDDALVTRFLRAAYSDALMRSRRIAFDLLSVIENERIVRKIESALRLGTRRARGDALEVLSNLADRDAAQALVVLHEAGAFEDRLPAVGQMVRVPGDQDALLDASMRSEVRWIRLAAHALYDPTSWDENDARLMERLLALRKIPLFEHLTLDQLEAVHKLTQESTYAAGENICRQGEPGNELFLLLEGIADVYIGEAAERRQVNSYAAVDYFGEMAVFDDEPRSATIVAREQCQLLTLDGISLKELVLQMPEISFEIFRVLSNRVRVAEQRTLEGR